ncbi:MAG: Beta-lactamase [Gemmatimonadetes bacterium]|nr:Beta-lactamase [Gemmatimonadota bacterium]
MRPGKAVAWLCLAILLPTSATAQDGSTLEAALRTRLARDTAVVAVALHDPISGLKVLLRADLRFHAASTMKVPVLVELARRVDAGELGWDEPWPVRNGFASIVDGSPYRLSAADDSDSTLYAMEGRAVPVGELARLMIVRSSNLATNILIERLGPARVNATAGALGADSIEVLRGVEDTKAFRAGRNNTTTARDLATLLLAIADGRTASDTSSNRMLAILEAQEFNDGIPAGLPPGTRVAHKTGEITATFHDAALIWTGGRSDGQGVGRADGPYALVVLTRGYADRDGAMAVMREVAAMAHTAVLRERR